VHVEVESLALIALMDSHYEFQEMLGAPAMWHPMGITSTRQIHYTLGHFYTSSHFYVENKMVIVFKNKTMY